ncbi:hypothetical protein [Lysinibacillus parviboronicapiens]|uniref:hypothetical protein n=1 Tax=Lysinibacillus parviboronicapiens TaxID=436516 RepID=UPI0006D24F9A|nr:hypothetical protein [Lysinibacillus parviboronicapiens]
MLRLLKLRRKKHPVPKYFIGGFIGIVAICFVAGLIEGRFKVDSVLMFTDYLGFMSLMHIFIKLILIIFIAVSLFRLIMEDYNNPYGLPILNILSMAFMTV